MGGLPTWSSFLARRIVAGDAHLRHHRRATDRSVAETGARRQSAAHAGRVDMERQNRDLLKSMNERTRLQFALADHGRRPVGRSRQLLRSRAVRLSGERPARRGVPVDISLATALFVPIAVVAIWLVVRPHPGQTYRARLGALSFPLTLDESAPPLRRPRRLPRPPAWSNSPARRRSRTRRGMLVSSGNGARPFACAAKGPPVTTKPLPSTVTQFCRPLAVRIGADEQEQMTQRRGRFPWPWHGRETSRW